VPDPDEVVAHIPQRCRGCGADLTLAPVIGVEARQVFDLSEVRLGATEHRAERRWCGCGTVTAAGFPDQARSAACYGPGVRALGCCLLAWQHLPVERAGELLAQVLGAGVASGTLAALLAEGAAGLGGFAEAVCAQLAAAEVAHFDQTGARVAGRLHWVHSASTELLSWLTVDAKRGADAMEAAGVLPEFRGVAVHDGWAPYWRYDKAAHALCGAHLLRELDGIVGEPGQGWAGELAEWLSVACGTAARARDAGTAGWTRRWWRACWAATTRSSPRGMRPTRPRPARRATGAGCGGRRPPTCWSGWTSTATRWVGSWSTCRSRSPTTRPSVICAW
jgi:transposase